MIRRWIASRAFRQRSRSAGRLGTFGPYLLCLRSDLMGRTRVAIPSRRRGYVDLPNIDRNEHRPRRGSGSASTWMFPAGMAPASHRTLEPGFRGHERRRSAGAAGVSHEHIRFGSRREPSHELVRVGNRRDRKRACQSSIRGHHAFVFRASGGGAAGHHPRRLHRGASGGRAVLRAAPAALRRAQADHDLRSLFTRSGRGHEADGYRGHLPGRLGDVRQGIVTEDPGPDLASYPLSQVPEEAAPIVRALLTADRNQRFARSRMTEEQRAAAPEIDYRPFIIADADTGHGGDAHVRNLIRRFVEAGRARLPHRGPEARRQEVRAPGRQGARRRGRADQAPERRPLPARRHARARHHRGADRRRVGHPPRRAQRRARPAVHPGRHQRSTCRPTRSAFSPCSGSSTSWGSRSCAATCCTRSPRGVRRGRRLARPDGRATRSSKRSRRSTGRPAGRRWTSCSTGLETRYLDAWQPEANVKTLSPKRSPT